MLCLTTSGDWKALASSAPEHALAAYHKAHHSTVVPGDGAWLTALANSVDTNPGCCWAPALDPTVGRRLGLCFVGEGLDLDPLPPVAVLLGRLDLCRTISKESFKLWMFFAHVFSVFVI